jgi:hypothetical protein
MRQEIQGEPPPLDPQRFHERWGEGTFELIADRRPWSADAAVVVVVVVVGGFAMLVLLVFAAVGLWSSNRLMSIVSMVCLPIYLAFWGPAVLGMRFSRVCITLSRHEVRFVYRTARIGERELSIPRADVVAFEIEKVRVAGSGVGGQRTVDRLVARTRDGTREIGWKTFASENPLFKQLAARLNWALAQVDQKQTYRD